MRPDDRGELAAIDFVLQQGEPAARQALKRRAASDPLAAIELADAVMFVEQFRSLRTEASEHYVARLDRLVQRAAMKVQRLRPRWHAPLTAAAATVIGFVGLRWWHPLQPAPRADVHASWPREAPAAPAVMATVVPTVAVATADPGAIAIVSEPSPEPLGAPNALADSLAFVRQRLQQESSPCLRVAFDEALRDNDALTAWLAPRNAMARLQADYERCIDAGVREALLRRRGGLPEVDGRVQALAAAIGVDLAALLDRVQSAGFQGGGIADDDRAAIGSSLRALLAAGSGGQHQAIVAAGCEVLAAELPRLSGARLATTLAVLTEVAAVRGSHRDVVAMHGARLVDDVLRVDAQNWERNLPELVGTGAPSHVLGEAGRLLGRLPGCGVSARHAGVVRGLVLGQLRSRRQLGEERAEVLAALLYGFADLLPEAERADIEFQLLRWRPSRLLPDYDTVTQQIWGLMPGRCGFTRLQIDRRRLAVVPTPAELQRRAGLCLCLAADFAAFGCDPVLLARS